MVATIQLPFTRAGFAPQTRPVLAALLRRPGLLFLHGHAQTSRLAHYFLAGPLLRGEVVLFLDAANCFDPFRLAALARQRGRSAEELLGRVRISRAFTCFQMAELIERTAEAAQRFGARRIVLTGFPDIFDDEEISAAEAEAVFRRSLAVLERWPSFAKATGGGPALTALVFSDGGAPPSRLGLRLQRQLARQATGVYRLEEGPAGLALVSTLPSSSSVQATKGAGEKILPRKVFVINEMNEKGRKSLQLRSFESIR